MRNNLFKFGRAVADSHERNDSADKMMAEARAFPLAQTGGFLAVVKYAVFAILASLNFHLFYTHVPAYWGVLLGCTALLFEACTVYFWNQQNRSAGRHKRALQIFAVTFTVTSFVHGCAALYQLSEVGPDLAGPIIIYSKYVAFPLLFGLMIGAVCVTHYLHWSTQVSEARAAALLEVERGRAELITETVAMDHAFQIEQARLDHFRRRVLHEEEYVGEIEKYAQVKQRGERVLASISDPDTKRELYSALGRTTSETPMVRRIAPLSPAVATSPTGDPDPK
jgi:hypothetical protein